METVAVVRLFASRMNREVHVRFCGSLWVKFPQATRRRTFENFRIAILFFRSGLDLYPYDS